MPATRELECQRTLSAMTSAAQKRAAGCSRSTLGEVSGHTRPRYASDTIRATTAPGRHATTRRKFGRAPAHMTAAPPTYSCTSCHGQTTATPHTAVLMSQHRLSRQRLSRHLCPRPLLRRIRRGLLHRRRLCFRQICRCATRTAHSRSQLSGCSIKPGGLTTTSLTSAATTTTRNATRAATMAIRPCTATTPTKAHSGIGSMALPGRGCLRLDRPITRIRDAARATLAGSRRHTSNVASPRAGATSASRLPITRSAAGRSTSSCVAARTMVAPPLLTCTSYHGPPIAMPPTAARTKRSRSRLRHRCLRFNRPYHRSPQRCHLYLRRSRFHHSHLLHPLCPNPARRLQYLRRLSCLHPFRRPRRRHLLRRRRRRRRRLLRRRRCYLPGSATQTARRCCRK